MLYNQSKGKLSMSNCSLAYFYYFRKELTRPNFVVWL